MYAPALRVDGRGCLLTPGLVNTHHHLYQWATRGYAQQSTLFEWLTTLYPRWSRLDEEAAYVSPLSGVLANYAYNALLTGRPFFLELIEDAEIAGRFAREKLGASRVAVATSVP